ncbi:18316_t:CDS:10, partial [Gigaspora margarita]
MAAIGGFLFGNVDEEGHLEDSGLGEEIRESLQKGAEEGAVLSQIFSVRSLGIEIDDAAAESEASAHTPTYAPEESSTKHADGAVDYSESMEVYTDDPGELVFTETHYQQGLNRLNRVKEIMQTSSLPSQQTLNFEETSYYKMEDIHMHGISSLPKNGFEFHANAQHDIEMAGSQPSANEIFDIKTLYPAFEKDKILKFSDLFATKTKNRKLNPLSRHDETQLQFNFEIDDRKLFESSQQFLTEEPCLDDNVDNKAIIGTPTSPMSQISENNYEIDDVDFKLDDDKHVHEVGQLFWKVPDNPNTYYSITMSTWEDKISWDSDGDEGDDESASYRNTEFESGEWLNSILWDDHKGFAPFAKLTLDMNDPNMLFNYSTIDLPTMTNPELQGQYDVKRIKKKSPMEIDKSLNFDAYKSVAFDDSPPYEASFDNEQMEFKRRLNSGQMFVHHSLPALQLHIQYFKTKFTKSDIRALHRPTIQFPLNHEIHLSRIKSYKKLKKRKHYRKREEMRSPKDLTLKDNTSMTLCRFLYLRRFLIELQEEYPPILSNIGMGSLLLNYYRKTDPYDTYVPELSVGDPVILDMMDESPFMNFGDVERGQVIPSLFNNLIRAPLFSHDAKDTDFLIRNLFVVGQTFPMQEVPSPPSRKAKTTANNRIQVAAFRLMKNNRYHYLIQDKLAKRFPDHTEFTLRTRLKDIAELARKKGNVYSGPIWKLKPSIRLPSEEELRKMLTPEMICLEESMMVGERHLADAGYKPSTNEEEDGSSKAKNDDDDAQDDSKLALEESKLPIEQQLAPWITTRNFLNATQTNAMLKLHGEGDPTGRGEGFSFIRISMKDIFLKAGETAQEKLGYYYEFTFKSNTTLTLISKLLFLLLLAEVVNKPKSGHKYNVVEQWKRYGQEVYRIWNAQFSSLSRRDEIISDTELERHDDSRITESGQYMQEQFMNNDDNQMDIDAEIQEMIDSTMPNSEMSPSPALADFEDVASPDGSIGSRANYNCGSHRNRALSINRLIRTENGEKFWTKTLVTDPAVINAYVRNRQLIEEQLLSAELLEPTNDEEKNKRMKKRIEDQLAKLRRNQERRQQPITKEKKHETVRRCGNCGQSGHMKTNKKCPRYGLSSVVDTPTTGPSSSPASTQDSSVIVKMEVDL